DVALGGQIVQSLLPLLGRLAYRVDEANVGVGKTATQRGNQLDNSVPGLSRLRDDTQSIAALQLVEVGLLQNDGVIVQIAYQAAHLDVPGLSNDDGVASFGNQLGEGLVDALHQRAGGVVYVIAFLLEFKLDAISRAVRGKQNRLRLHLFGAM